MNLPLFLGFVRRRLLPILACIVAALVGAAAITATTPKTYRATTRLFVSIPAARGVQEALQGVQLSSQLLQSYTRIATSRAAAARVSQELEGQFTPGEIRSKVSASTQPETLLIDISASDVDPTSARDIANASAKVLSSFVSELESGKEGAIEARVIDPAVTPGTPISPKPATNLALGLILGLGVGLAVALVLEATDRSLLSAAQAAEAARVPVLATVPRHRHLDSEPLPAREGLAAPGGEAYRALRTAVRFVSHDQPLRTILVSSPSSGEGKTTTAANLAIAFAQSGERVIAIDGDLRKPKLATLFAPSGNDGPGLTSVLTASLDLDDALRQALDRLEILPPGPLPTNPSELLGSEAMAALLEVLSERVDVVILDAPPVLPVTDAVVLSTLVDAVVLVLQWGRTETLAADDASQALQGVGANLIGCVLNGVRGGRTARYYRSYGRTPTAVTAPARRTA